MTFELGDQVFVQSDGSFYVLSSNYQGKSSSVQLTIKSWQNLQRLKEEMETNIMNIQQKWVNKHHHIGEDIYVTISSPWERIHIYPWYKGMNRLNRKIISLTFSQWKTLMSYEGSRETST